jgi:hypothetical protein
VTLALDFTPPVSQSATAVTVLIGYRGGVLTLPDADVRQRVRPLPPLPQAFSVNDLGYAVRVVMSRADALQGTLFTARFATCSEASAPTAADVTCLIEGCSGGSGPIPGAECACAVRLQP